MLQAGRFDEARECFETSIRHVPERGSGYRGMAELFLMRRDSPAESRNASDVALRVTEAITGVGSGNIYVTAQVHYHSGCAHAELGDLRASTLQYREAARLDPQGPWGRAAQAALKSGAQSEGPGGAA